MKSAIVLCLLFVATTTLGYTNPMVRNPWTPGAGLNFSARHGLKYEIQIHDNMWVAFEVDAAGETATFAVAVPTSGWVALGPTWTGSMIGANPCVVMQPSGSANVTAVAMHSEAMVTPTVNADQNCILLDYEVVDGETFAMWERPVVGCKPEDLDISQAWEQRWVGAWGTTIDQFTYHGLDNRVTAFFSAFYGPLPEYELPDDVAEHDAVMKPFELPPTRDIYYCRGMELPQDRRYHVVKMDPLLYSITPAVYHHIILYDCPNGIPNEWSDGENKLCPGSGGVPGCTRFWTGWATGQPAYYLYPAPLAMGIGEIPVVKSVVIEAHIDHPEETPGIVDDGWGLKLWYTPTLLDIESQVLGLYVGINQIPPRMDAFTLIAECPQNCMRGMPLEGVVFTGVSPHMHSIGLQAKLTLVRNGVEMPVPHQLGSWDSNWQGMHFVHPDHEVRFMPGDRLMASCTWDSSDREDPTYFGEGYLDEMCTPYISFYPALPSGMTICSEWPGRVVPDDNNQTISVGWCNAAPGGGVIDLEPFVAIEEPNNCQI